MSEADIIPAPPTARRQASSGVGIAAKWIGVPLAAVVAGGILASIAVGIWFNVTQKDRLLDDLSTGAYPESAVVCRHADAACATDAAERAGRQIAWVPDGRGFDTTAVVVTPRGAANDRPVQAFQDGTFRDALVTIENDPLETDPLVREVQVGTIDMPGGISGTRYRGSDEDSSSASARWKVAGRSYRIAITAPFGDSDDAMRLLHELAGRVRYSQRS